MTIEVKLTKNQVAIIDDIDSDLLDFKWNYHPKGYAQLASIKKGPLMHRVILERKLGRELDKFERSDHVNGNGLDNRRSNLRVATMMQNMWNQRLSKNNTSGYKGVYLLKKDGLWRAQIMVNRKAIFLGDHIIPEDAARAYDKAAKQYHGEFARLNFE